MAGVASWVRGRRPGNLKEDIVDESEAATPRTALLDPFRAGAERQPSDPVKMMSPDLTTAPPKSHRTALQPPLCVSAEGWPHGRVGTFRTTRLRGRKASKVVCFRERRRSALPQSLATESFRVGRVELDDRRIAKCAYGPDLATGAVTRESSAGDDLWAFTCQTGGDDR